MSFELFDGLEAQEIVVGGGGEVLEDSMYSLV